MGEAENDSCILELVNPESNKSYCINLSLEDHNRALTDHRYAQVLLRQAEACNVGQPTTEVNSTEKSPDENRTEHVDKLWPNENILLLISLVKKYEKDFESSVKKYIWQKIAKELSEKTKINYTFTQTDTKWKGLVRTYKDVVKHNNTSGKAKKYWDYFDVVHEIVFKRPEITAPATCSSHNGLITSSSANSQDSNSVHASCSSSNNGNNKWESSFTKKRKERDAQIAKRHEDKMRRLDKLQASIDRMVDLMEKKKQESEK